MAKECVRRRGLVAAGLLLGTLSSAAVAQELNETALGQIRAIYADKGTWTPAQKKLDTSLIYASRGSLGRPMVQGMTTGRDLALVSRVASRAGVGSDGMVVVDIRAKVTDQLILAIAGVGGKVMSAFPAFDAVRARIPVRRVEEIAGLAEVRNIGPRQQLLLNPTAVTSEGDTAHAAAAARIASGLDGTGVKIGVLSDGVDSLADRQVTLDLPPDCASPPGAGACVEVVRECDLTGYPPGTTCGDEGTAMMEIVHDLAPGAQLYFATAMDGDAAFAQNILDLKNVYGCDVIVDDVTYLNEGAFQDGVIAKAVATVTNAGALYFSSAGNSGRKDDGTSGTWEGDYFQTCWYLNSTAHLFHGFDGVACPSTVPADPLTDDSPVITLKWSDPLGKSGNDYDLLLLDPTGTSLLAWSANIQNGNDDPFEGVYPGYAGDLVAVVRWAGAARALRVDTNRGRLSISTAGAIVGHNGAESAITVAATDGRVPGVPNPFVGGTTNPIEYYSSDGPRRMFYNPNGTAITSGKVTFASGGGRTLQKPDITAADCVTTTTPDFAPFCGTSAAAPHAAAIAALLKSAPNNPSADQVLAPMFSTALDVDPTGRDRNAGVGIVMADTAVAALTNPPLTSFNTVSPCRVFDTRLVAAQTNGKPLTCGTAYDFTMVDGSSPLVACGVPSGAKAVSINMTVTAPTVQGNLKAFASGTPPPTGAVSSYVAKDTRANNAVVSLDSAGKMAVQCSSGTAHVIVDVNGYFQ